MKKIKKDIIFWILMILPFLVSAFFIIMLPKQIPSNLLGLEEELVSKYTVLRTNILIALMEFVFYFVNIRYAENKINKLTEEREKVVQKNATSHNRSLMLILFVIMNLLNFSNLLLTYLICKGVEMNLADISAVMVGLTLGVCLITLGNVMPRMHEDQEPFKSKWNNVSPRTRRKINQSCGLGLVLCGMISIIITILIHNVYSIMITFGLILVTAVILYIISCMVYAKEEKRN